MTINKPLFIYLTSGFILFIVIGTLTHELGHYLVAKHLGYNAEINYANAYYSTPNPNDTVGLSDSFFISLGGPLETILTGTIGLVLLYSFRKSFQAAPRLSFGQWTLIFISLLWLRQPINFVLWMGGYLFNGQFSDRSDEIQIARHLQFPDWTITSLTAIMGAIVLAIIVFKFIPKPQRLTFITSGLVGGVSGYFLWLHWLGQKIMP